MTTPMTTTTYAAAHHGSIPPTVVEIDGFRGRLINASDADYDVARAIWNGAIDRRPHLIARCIGTADVVAAVRFARDHDLEIAIQGGGHGVAGTAVCDDGIVIDLSAMRGVRVDPAGRRAWVQGGALGATSTARRGARPGHHRRNRGCHAGVAGLTLGGGIGWLMRKHGLAVDNLLAADVVTADGERLRVSGPSTPTCSGRCAAAAATSAWSPRSSSASTPSGPPFWPGPSSGTRATPGRYSFLPRLHPRRPRRARHGRKILHRAASIGHPRGTALAPGGDGGRVLRRADRGR